MNAHINFTSLFEGEPLKPNMSNFIDWYERLRSLLKRSDAFFMIIEPLGPELDDDADEATIFSSISPKMRDWFYST
jgi:hypothetical protein